MTFRLMTDSQIAELDRVMAWAKVQMGMRTSERPPEAQPHRTLPNIRGYLLQNVYSGGCGVMRLAQRLVVPNATQVTIVGVNYVPQSAFKLTLQGIPKSQQNATAQSIFTTDAISVTSSAADMQSAIYNKAIASNLPVSPTDFIVTLGNPVPSPALIQLSAPAVQPEVDFTKSPPESYVGSWVINITGVLVNQFYSLGFVILQDNTAFMRGMSAVVAKPVVDVPSNTEQIVWDVNNRPPDYPWTAGSLCVASHFLGIGYGLMNTDFRNQSISIPAS
jgi:hypothetical protein